VDSNDNIQNLPTVYRCLEEEVEISELSEVHLAKRRRNSLRSLRGDGCCLPLRRKREKLRRKTGMREREREREKQRGER